MRVSGICHICGKSASYTCSLCGKATCGQHIKGGICTSCLSGQKSGTPDSAPNGIGLK